MPLTVYPTVTETDASREIDDPRLTLSSAFREELLDPVAWRDGLEKYARAMHLAIALVDEDGHLLGPCLNPQPLWSLLHSGEPKATAGCPFSLAAVRSCICVDDALNKGAVVRARDRAGLIHFTVPLSLSGHTLGALVAGQVFDQFPDQLLLEHVAKKLGISSAKAWEKARLEHPVSQSMLRVYEELLVTLGHTFLQSRYHTLLEASRLTHLREADEVLRKANDELERRVEERTAALGEAQEKSLQAERLATIGQMAAGLAHEGGNALQRIQAGLTRLGYRLQGQTEALSLVDNIQKAQDDLHGLFEEVRAYAAPVRLEPRTCNLAEVWREAWADLGPARGTEKAELVEEVVTHLQCEASPFHLKQVFRNLLHNALAVTRGPVRIIIRCSEATTRGEAAVRVSVRDNGSGFTAEQRAKAFEPFFTTKAKGTGLGLPICRRLVEAHGGTIELGTSVGPGAEIIVILPRRMA